MGKLTVGLDNHSTPTYCIDAVSAADVTAGYNKIINIAADTNKTLTVPANQHKVLFTFSPGANVLFSVGASAITAPTTDFVSSLNELNPVGRDVSPGDTLNFFSIGDTSIIQVRYFQS
jgi:hypothetical protein